MFLAAKFMRLRMLLLLLPPPLRPLRLELLLLLRDMVGAATDARYGSLRPTMHNLLG